jgi:glycosyltransferase involved in cell wall biosynthesis
MTLRVALDARALDLPYLRGQGIGRYTSALLDALGPVSHERGGQLIVMRTGRAGPAPFPAQAVEPVLLRRPRLPDWLALPCEQLLLPRDLRRAGAQVLHASSIYRAVPAPGLPWVVGLHDVIPLLFPQDYLRSGLLYRLMYAAVRRATVVLTVSHRARADIVRELGLAPESVAVVPGAAGRQFQPTAGAAELLARLGVTPPYLLYVGGLSERDPRKGVSQLIDAFAEWVAAGHRPETLVLTGRVGQAAGPLREQAKARGAPVVFTDFVADEDLPALYTAAMCLVTASRYEGFGLPALEALACGTPVAAYRVGAHEEVAGPGALLVRDGDASELMRSVQRLCDEPELRARLAAAGRAHANTFSWRRSAELTWQAYEQVLTRRSVG